MKVCSNCDTEKSFNEFYERRNDSYGDGYAGQCKVCIKDKGMQRKYGITLEEYFDILDHQGGVCAICKTDKWGKDNKPHIDHDHETGLVRALLCTTCNMGLGSFRDDISLLARAIEYLVVFTESNVRRRDIE